jgi:DNA-binding MarR family transcriptional regulator
MDSVPDLKRSQQIDYVSGQLLARAGRLTRLLARELDGALSRTEAGVLSSLEDGPRRVTELAELEGLAQPTMTLLVKQLEGRGLARRERHADDGRVVLVEVTEAGNDALAGFRGNVQTALRCHLEQMSDAQVEALVSGTDALQAVITALQQGASA